MPVQPTNETALVDALGEVFSRYGNEGASISRLSEATGLKRSSLYHRFPGGKDEIVDAVVGRAAERYEVVLAPAFADGPPRQRAEQVAARLDDYYRSGVAPCLLIAFTVSEEDDRSMAGSCIDAWADALMQIALDAGLDPQAAEAAAMDVIASIEGGLVISATSGKTAAYERALHTLPDRLTGTTRPADEPISTLRKNTEKQPKGTDMSETAAITKVIEQYVDGGVQGKADVMAPSFHEFATIYSVVDGKADGGPIKTLFDAVDGNPAPNLTGVVGAIEVNETTATASVVLSDWGGANFNDQFTLLKTDGSWKILSKVFYDRG